MGSLEVLIHLCNLRCVSNTVQWIFCFDFLRKFQLCFFCHQFANRVSAVSCILSNQLLRVEIAFWGFFLCHCLMDKFVEMCQSTESTFYCLSCFYDFLSVQQVEIFRIAWIFYLVGRRLRTRINKEGKICLLRPP